MADSFTAFPSPTPTAGTAAIGPGEDMYPQSNATASPDDPHQIELQVIQDVLDAVESRIRELETRGWRLTVPRSRVYATVLLAVVVSAREAHRVPATLDRAMILDDILDGAEPYDRSGARLRVEDTIRAFTTPAN
ncbi:hypothetical protein [Nocardia sp. NPDC020380]|uniref:hypothetical protein n=1 Tax=Nocardia sp. NPDC020380 TaxID=3364309 RepID=UPI0037A0091D